MMRRVLFSTAAMALLAVSAACSSPASNDSTSPAAPAAKAAAITPAALDRGREIYKSNCAACHGEKGKGDGPAAGVMKPAPRDHTDRAYMSTMSDADLAKVIQMGGAVKGKPLMPSNPQIRGTDLDAVVAFTRSLSEAAQP